MSTNSVSSFGSTEGENTEFLSALGELVIECARFEDELSGFIAILLDCAGPENWGSIITSELSIKQKIPVVMSLYLQRNQTEEKTETLRIILLEYQDKLSTERDLYVHSYWYLPTTGPSAMLRKDKSRTKTGFARKLEPVTPKQLRDLTNRVESSRLKISDIALQYMKETGIID